MARVSVVGQEFVFGRHLSFIPIDGSKNPEI
jgi:hypothetical protein